jgi:CubicO group peptidase (beta-lactamase class C family)
LTSFTFEEPPLDLPLACIPRLANPPAQWQWQLDHFQGHPAAGLKGTFTDVLKFLSFQTHKCVWEGKTLLQEKYWTEMHTPQFDPNKPGFDSWGLGMLVRGNGPRRGMLSWFGLIQLNGSQIFSHAGTNVALAVGDPDTDIQIVLMVTDTPTTHPKVEELRNTVTSTIFGAVS